jgi:LysR family transcriptional regulator, low CO2-responsive transcriptional regulator
VIRRISSDISAHTVATELDERRLATLDVVGLPSSGSGSRPRKDKVLLSPAQAMIDFLSAKDAQFLPRTHGRLRLTRPSARTRRG